MNNPIPHTISQSQAQPWSGYGRGSGSNLLFGLGVALLVCGAAITGRHEATMIGLGLIIFSSFCDC
ncbi:MAG TPA: hypothetical protein VHX37_16700 [Acidobacteriaceae bacterium]|nr:hypothetical protein [Acidobacteriaceae bacterium]